MKLFLLLIATIAGDLIGFNRVVNSLFQHARGKLTAPSVDSRIRLIKYLLHLGRKQEAQKLMRSFGDKHNGKPTERFKRYKRRQNW